MKQINPIIYFIIKVRYYSNVYNNFLAFFQCISVFVTSMDGTDSVAHSSPHPTSLTTLDSPSQQSPALLHSHSSTFQLFLFHLWFITVFCLALFQFVFGVNHLDSCLACVYLFSQPVPVLTQLFYIILDIPVQLYLI